MVLYLSKTSISQYQFWSCDDLLTAALGHMIEALHWLTSPPHKKFEALPWLTSRPHKKLMITSDDGDDY